MVNLNYGGIAGISTFEIFKLDPQMHNEIKI